MADNIQISPETKTKISAAMYDFWCSAGIISQSNVCEQRFCVTPQGLRYTISISGISGEGIQEAYLTLSQAIFNAFSAAAKPLYKEGLISGFAALQAPSASFRIIASGANVGDSASAILELIQAAEREYQNASEAPSPDV